MFIKLISILFVSLISTGVSAGESLYGGLANIEFTPGKGVPVAGYGGGKRRLIPWDVRGRYQHSKYFKPNQGKIDPIRSKALVLEKAGKRLLFISLDLVGTISHFKTDLLKKISSKGFHKDNIFITSTHTHSGPGAITYNSFWAMLAMDKFSRKIYDEFMNDMIASIDLAIKRLEPVELLNNSFKVYDIQKNRRARPGHFDNQANMILVKSINKQTWLGGVVNFALHGTALGQSNQKYSADAPGAIEREMESRLIGLNKNSQSNILPTVLFINGALGDVTPIIGGVKNLKVIGNRFANQAMSSLGSLKLLEAKWEINSSFVHLGKPGLSVYNCTSKGWFGRLIGRSRRLRNARISLRRWLPYKAELHTLKLGDILMMTWPGEPSTSLGLELKKIANSSGVNQSWVLGLTNNHLAYFVTPEEMRKGGTESCTSFYGLYGGQKILKQYQNMIFNK